MPFGRSFSGAVLCALAFSGCVSEPGRTGPALWTSIETDTSSQDVSLKNPVRMHTTYGRMAEANGKRVVARQHFQKALSHDPKSVNAIIGIARLDQHAGQIRSAEQGFQKALKLAPKNPDVLQSAGLFYASQSRWRDAIVNLKAAMTAAPNVREHRYLLAVVMAKSGDYQGAMPHFTATVGRAKGHNEVGYFLFKQGSHREAERQVRIALSLDPNLTSARRLLARLQNHAHLQNNSQGHIARPPVRTTNNRRTRSVGHTVEPNGLGGQSAWKHDDDQTSRRSPRGNAGTQSVPSRESHRIHEPRNSTLNISPGTHHQYNRGSTIDPRRAINHSDSRVRTSATIDSRHPEGSDFTRRPIPQWNHQGADR